MELEQISPFGDVHSNHGIEIFILIISNISLSIYIWKHNSH